MRVGLFIPCYVDQFYPHVGIATYKLLKKYGCEVEYPEAQVCCGQPMANSGFEHEAEAATASLLNVFEPFDYIVAPTGSCVLHLREHLPPALRNEKFEAIAHRAYELCQFLHDILQVDIKDARFPHKVGLHISCHGQRGLRLAQSSEIVGDDYSSMKSLLQQVNGLELIDLGRKDECCGFGGTFAVSEEAVSVSMGCDRIDDHLAHGAEVITGGDMSCLMHLEGLVKRKKLNVKVMHIAEILNHQ